MRVSDLGKLFHITLVFRLFLLVVVQFIARSLSVHGLNQKAKGVPVVVNPDLYPLSLNSLPLATAPIACPS